MSCRNQYPKSTRLRPDQKAHSQGAADHSTSKARTLCLNFPSISLSLFVVGILISQCLNRFRIWMVVSYFSCLDFFQMFESFPKLNGYQFFQMLLPLRINLLHVFLGHTNIQFAEWHLGRQNIWTSYGKKYENPTMAEKPVLLLPLASCAGGSTRNNHHRYLTGKRRSFIVVLKCFGVNIVYESSRITYTPGQVIPSLLMDRAIKIGN